MKKYLALLSLLLFVSVSRSAPLPDALRKRLVFDYFLEYDHDGGINATTMEYTILLAAGGNERAKAMAQKMLDTHHDWNGADGLRIHALAYSLWKRPDDLKAAKDIYHVVASSMDASAVEAVLALYMVTGEENILKKAKNTATWMSVSRKKVKGGFQPDLSDTLAKGRAYLALFTATGDRSHLPFARMAAEFIETNFKVPAGGYGAGPLSREENISLARFLNLLADVTGNQVYGEMAGHAMQYLISSDVAMAKPPAGVLLAEAELGKEPLHLVVVGSKKDAMAKALFVTARTAYPLLSKRLEWFDRAEGPLPNADVTFPDLTKAAAFLCADGRCSLPIFTVERLQNRLATF